MINDQCPEKETETAYKATGRVVQHMRTVTLQLEEIDWGEFAVARNLEDEQGSRTLHMQPSHRSLELACFMLIVSRTGDGVRGSCYV